MIEELEKSLVPLLASKLAVPVKLYPVNPSKYSMQSATGEVLVRYVGRKPTGQSLDAAFGMKKLQFKLSFVFRKLRGEQGLYQAIEGARELLENNQIQDSLPINFNAESFTAEQAGIWEYQQDYSFDYAFKNHLNTV